eukprot:TRINITY_DN13113_c0_g1_i1.p1 TRINITY_DN13113_c0_g1~~TRINITY_DN13113_c0_g1_i1.p1  ORF type:complete len:341 (+),score=108.89 TRINITY_DN13113_c0_g1_i1:70-1023(+)
MTEESAAAPKSEGFWAGVTTAVAAVGGTLENLVEDVEGTLDGVMGVTASEVSNSDKPQQQKEEKEAKSEEPSSKDVKVDDHPNNNNNNNNAGWKKIFGGIVDTIHEVATDLITDEAPPTPSPDDKNESTQPEHEQEPEPEEEEAASEPATPPRSYPTVLKAQSPAESVSDSAGTDKRIDQLVAEWTKITAEGTEADVQPLSDIIQEIEMELALDGAVKLETLDKMGRTTAINLYRNPSDTTIHEDFLSQVDAVENLAYATLLSPVKSSAEPQSPSSLSDRDHMDTLRRGVTALREAVSLFYSRVLSGNAQTDSKTEG